MNISNVTDGNVTNKTAEFIQRYLAYMDKMEKLFWGGDPRYISIVTINMFLILFGTIFNMTAIVIIIRRRLWYQHEGYVHLLAILINNIFSIAIHEIPFITFLIRWTHHIRLASDAVCKMWNFLSHIQYFTTLFVIALLLDIYLRRQQVIPTGRFKAIAYKYCTIRGAKIAIFVVLGLFVFINLWRLMYYELYERNYYGRVYKSCYADDFRLVGLGWEVAQKCLVLYLPVFILPALLFLIRFTGRGSSPPSSDPESDDLTKTSIYIGISLLICIVPFALYYIGYHLYLLRVTKFTRNVMFFFLVLNYICIFIKPLFLIVMPVLCLTVLSKLRDEVRSTLRGKCFLRNAYSTNVQAEYGDLGQDNGTVTLDVVGQNPQFPMPGEK